MNMNVQYQPAQGAGAANLPSTDPGFRVKLAQWGALISLTASSLGLVSCAGTKTAGSEFGAPGIIGGTPIKTFTNHNVYTQSESFDVLSAPTIHRVAAEGKKDYDKWVCGTPQCAPRQSGYALRTKSFSHELTQVRPSDASEIRAWINTGANVLGAANAGADVTATAISTARASSRSSSRSSSSSSSTSGGGGNGGQGPFPPAR